MTRTTQTLLTAVALAAAAVILLVPGTGSASPVPTSWEVVFTSPMDGMSDIYSMTPDGKALNLTHDRDVRADVQPHWSPDGTQILFTRYLLNGGASIMRVNADGEKLVNLTPSFSRSVQSIDPNWSPDGSRIVFASNRDGNFDLYTMNTEGQKVARLTKTNSPTANIEPDWAPNGKGFVFTRQGTATDRFETSSLWFLSSASRTATQLTHPKRFEGDRGAVWSPDATKIAFHSDRAGSSDLYVLDMTLGTGPERVTWSGKSETDPAWAVDGASLVYVSTATGDTEFWMLNLKGMGPSPEQQLTFDGQNKAHPDWKSTPTPTPGTDPAESNR